MNLVNTKNGKRKKKGRKIIIQVYHLLTWTKHANMTHRHGMQINNKCVFKEAEV